LFAVCGWKTVIQGVPAFWYDLKLDEASHAYCEAGGMYLIERITAYVMDGCGGE